MVVRNLKAKIIDVENGFLHGVSTKKIFTDIPQMDVDKEDC
jgi:hypothetical protein